MMYEVERREHARQRVSRVEVRIASRESFRASYLRDLSLGGLFVRSRQPLATGTHVVVELSVAELAPTRLRGEVVRQEHGDDGQPRGFGVRFATVDAETRAAILRILELCAEGPSPSTVADLEARLAEARGTVEAYEESLALLRESEMELAQRLEAVETERTVLANVARELQDRVRQLESERGALETKIAALVSRVVEDETALEETSSRLGSELTAARALVARTAHEHEDEVTRLEAEHEAELALLRGELEAETARSAELRQSLEAELRALRSQLQGGGDGPLREELQDLSAQLDDERLKSMALERALQRFVAMGGIIPPRSE